MGTDPDADVARAAVEAAEAAEAEAEEARRLAVEEAKTAASSELSAALEAAATAGERRDDVSMRRAARSPAISGKRVQLHARKGTARSSMRSNKGVTFCGADDVSMYT